MQPTLAYHLPSPSIFDFHQQINKQGSAAMQRILLSHEHALILTFEIYLSIELMSTTSAV